MYKYGQLNLAKLFNCVLDLSLVYICIDLDGEIEYK